MPSTPSPMAVLDAQNPLRPKEDPGDRDAFTAAARQMARCTQQHLKLLYLISLHTRPARTKKQKEKWLRENSLHSLVYALPPLPPAAVAHHSVCASRARRAQHSKGRARPHGRRGGGAEGRAAPASGRYEAILDGTSRITRRCRALDRGALRAADPGGEPDPPHALQGMRWPPPSTPPSPT